MNESLTLIGQPLCVRDAGGRMRRYGVFRCRCGHWFDANIEHVNRGATRSCGCLQQEAARKSGRNNARHGMVFTPTYRSWAGMIARCSIRNSRVYSRYRGRGISVCERWRASFAYFLEDMGERPEATSIERIDNDGNYEPGNCKWATRIEQGSNKRNNRILTIDGVSRTMAEWSRESGAVGYKTIKDRLRHGWNHSEAVFSPLRQIPKALSRTKE